MSAQNIPNSNERELRVYRQFYITYHDTGAIVTEMAGTASNRTGLIGDIFLMQIRGLPNPEFNYENKVMRIRGLSNPEFQVPKEHLHKLLSNLSWLEKADNCKASLIFERPFTSLTKKEILCTFLTLLTSGKKEKKALKRR